MGTNQHDCSDLDYCATCMEAAATPPTCEHCGATMVRDYEVPAYGAPDVPTWVCNAGEKCPSIADQECDFDHPVVMQEIDGDLWVHGSNEGGYNGTAIRVKDIIAWVAKHRPALLNTKGRPQPQRWCVRVVLDGGVLGECERIQPLLPLLTGAGYVHLHRDDKDGLCFDLLPSATAGADNSQAWAAKVAALCVELGWNAVGAPAWPT